MPKFFFDFFDSGEVTPDNRGTELHGVDAAKQEAAKTLGAIVGDMLPGSLREFEIKIRDDADRSLGVVAVKLEMRASAL